MSQGKKQGHGNYEVASNGGPATNKQILPSAEQAKPDFGVSDAISIIINSSGDERRRLPER